MELVLLVAEKVPSPVLIDDAASIRMVLATVPPVPALSVTLNVVPAKVEIEPLAVNVMSCAAFSTRAPVCPDVKADTTGASTVMLPLPEVVCTVTVVFVRLGFNWATLSVDVVTAWLSQTWPVRLVSVVPVEVIVMESGSSSQLPPSPLTADALTAPSASSTWWDDVSTAPPLPDTAPPSAAIVPRNCVRSFDQTTTLPPLPAVTALAWMVPAGPM